MAGLRWGWFKPLAIAAVLTLVVGGRICGVAQTSSSGPAGSQQANIDPADFKHEYGVSSLDARHTVFVLAIFNTPWKLHNWAGHIANGWRLSGVGGLHSGLPYTMRTSGSVPHVVSPTSKAVFTGLGPSMNGSGGDNRVYGVGNNGVAYDIGRNTYRYPNAWKADIRLGKQIDLGKMRQLDLLGETFNLFNHRNVTEVETIGYSVASSGLNGSFPTLTYFTGLKANSTAFGEHLNSSSTSYYHERQVQFGACLRF